MLHIKKIVFIGCIALSSCMLEENKNFQLIEEKASGSGNQSPCNYNDSVLIDADLFDGTIEQKSAITNWDNYTVKLECAWGYFVVVTFKGGIKPQKTKVIDFATDYGYSIRYANGGNWEYKSVSGKMYCIVNPDKSITCNWCDVNMKGLFGDFSIASGGFTLK